VSESLYDDVENKDPALKKAMDVLGEKIQK
jgi:hypothetical protein